MYMYMYMYICVRGVTLRCAATPFTTPRKTVSPFYRGTSLIPASPRTLQKENA